MNSKAKAILWLGLFMIVMKVVLNWQQIKAVLFNSSSGGGSGPPGIGSKPGPHGKCPPGTTKTIDGRCVPIPHA